MSVSTAESVLFAASYGSAPAYDSWGSSVGLEVDDGYLVDSLDRSLQCLVKVRAVGDSASSRPDGFCFPVPASVPVLPKPRVPARGPTKRWFGGEFGSFMDVDDPVPPVAPASGFGRMPVPPVAPVSLLKKGFVQEVIPPVSNTGGKSMGMGLAWESKEEEVETSGWEDDLVMAISGEPKRGKVKSLAWESELVSIDTFSFSFSGERFGFDVCGMRKWVNRLTGGLIQVGGLLEQRYNGYYQCYQLCLTSGLESPMLGFLGLSLPDDHMRGRCFINLTGAACELMKPVNWAAMYSVCEDFEIKITRCDVAYDDRDGVHTVSEAKALYESGAFVLGGRNPSARYIDSYGGGNTFYVGRRENGKMLRVYEKGKQLGDKDSVWTRWELQLGCKDRVIPYDILLTPLAFLRGAYPVAMSWLVDVVGQVVKTVKRKSGIVFDAAIMFAKRQVGRIVRYCRDILNQSDESIIDHLIANPGRYPVRLFVDVVEHENLCLAA